MRLAGLIMFIVLLAGCSSKAPKPPQAEWDAVSPTRGALVWMPITEQAGQVWGVDPQLITAIIAVESGGNPKLVSGSNAVGLMQIKSNTAGREVYRNLGLKGEPSSRELKDPARNIDIGTAYLSILEKGILKGINDPLIMRQALVISYVNGAGALLRTFDSDRQRAIAKINKLSPQGFSQYIADNHPAPQAPRYLYKINRAIQAL